MKLSKTKQRFHHLDKATYFKMESVSGTSVASLSGRKRKNLGLLILPSFVKSCFWEHCIPGCDDSGDPRARSCGSQRRSLTCDIVWSDIFGRRHHDLVSEIQSEVKQALMADEDRTLVTPSVIFVYSVHFARSKQPRDFIR